MKRKLAVPLAVEQSRNNRFDPLFKTRMLRLSDEETEELKVMAKLAENRIRIGALVKEIEEDPGSFEVDDGNDLDYVRASIQLGLLEITGELEETLYSDELFIEATA